MKSTNQLFFKACKSRIVKTLNELIPEIASVPSALRRSMKYSMLNGGKRIRPLLLYTVGHSLGKPLGELDLIAASVELIHCYSLVHDDIPSMDDDDYRRGMLSCHRAFNEVTAILVGDAIQSIAFSIIKDQNISAILGQAIGSEGLVGGQYIDLSSKITKKDRLYQMKTGALIEASILMGAAAAKCKDTMILDSLKQISQKIGMIFQIQDDIFDGSISCGVLNRVNKRNFIKNHKEVMEGLDILPFETSLIKELYNNITYIV